MKYLTFLLLVLFSLGLHTQGVLAEEPFIIEGDKYVYLNDVEEPSTLEDIQELISVEDDVDGNITENISLIHNTYSGNENIIGDFLLIFSVTDSGDHVVQIAITVRNVDKNPPEINFEQFYSWEIPLYSDLISSLPKMTAVDSRDGDLTAYIEVEGLQGIDTNIPGTHELIFTVTDEFGNVTTIPKTLTIRDMIYPEIEGIKTIVKRSDYIVDGQFYFDYLTATDNEDGPITNRIYIVRDSYMGYADTPGTYEVVVGVTDQGGNETTFTLTITVVKDMIPHIIIDKYYWVIPNNHKFSDRDYIDTLKFINDLPNSTYAFTSVYDTYSDNHETLGVYYKNFELLSNTGKEYSKEITLQVVHSDLNIIEQDPSWLGSNWKLLLGGTAALFIVILFGVGIAKST